MRQLIDMVLLPFQLGQHRTLIFSCRPHSRNGKVPGAGLRRCAAAAGCCYLALCRSTFRRCQPSSLFMLAALAAGHPSCKLEGCALSWLWQCPKVVAVRRLPASERAALVLEVRPKTMYFVASKRSTLTPGPVIGLAGSRSCCQLVWLAFPK